MSTPTGAALVIGKEWWPKNYGVGLSLIHKELSINLAKTGQKVYSTALEATQEEIEDAKTSGVHLIVPQPRHERAIQFDDMADMLLLPRDYFSELEGYERISLIFGYVISSNETAGAARAFQEDICPSADFVPFFYDIPEESGLTSASLQKRENDIFDYAEKSKTLIYLGTRVFDHFKNKLRMLQNKTHITYLPWLGKDFPCFDFCPSALDQRIDLLSIYGVTGINAMKEFESAAMAMGKVVKYYEYDPVRLVWKFRGISEECHRDCKEYIEGKVQTGNLQLVPYPPISFPDEIKRDLQQCSLFISFSMKQDPFGIIGLMAMGAGIPVLIHKSSGIGTLIERHFPLHTSPLCDIGPMESTESASEKWKDKIMTTLKRYSTACQQAQCLKETLDKSAKDGVIAESKRAFTKWCASCIATEADKPNQVTDDKSDSHSRNADNSEKEQDISCTGKLSHMLRNGHEDGGESSRGDDTGGGDNDDNTSSLIQPVRTEIGEIEILVKVADVSPAARQTTTVDEMSRMIQDASDIMLHEIKCPGDLPRVEALLEQIGPIKIKLVKQKSLCLVLKCPTSNSLEKLWHEYTIGSLANTFKEDLVTVPQLQRCKASAVSLRVTIPSWKYRRALIRLKHFKEDYQPKVTHLKGCGVCGIGVSRASILSTQEGGIDGWAKKRRRHQEDEEEEQQQIRTRGERHDIVALQLDTCMYKDDAMRHGLSKLLGSCQTVVTEPDEEAAAMTTTITMLLELKRSQQLSMLISEKPEILSALGIQRLLILDDDQLSSIRVKDGDGYKYNIDDLSELVLDKAINIEHQAEERKHTLQSSDIVTRSVPSVLRLISEDEYLSIVFYLWEDHSETHQMLKSRQMECDILKNQLERTKSVQSKREQLQPNETEISDSDSRMEERLEQVPEVSPAMVALQLDTSLYKDDAMRLGLSKLLGSCQTVVTEPDEEAAVMTTTITMLLELQRSQQLSMLISEKSEILSALGIQRLLILDDDQLSSIRVKDGDGYKYSTNDLLDLMEDKAVDLHLQPQHLGCNVLTRSAPSMLRLLSRDEYLSVFSYLWGEHSETEKMLKCKQMEHDILQNEMEAMKSVVSQQDKSDDRIAEYYSRIKRENVSLRQRISDLENKGQGHQDLSESDDQKATDQMIEDFTFSLDIKSTKKSEREILMSLPCHFTWKLEEECDRPYKGRMYRYKETTYHPELSPTPHTAMMGYLQVSEIRPPEQRDPDAALSWFDKALQDNQKELDSCDDKDGPLGDKLVILADKAWVYQTLGQVDKVREMLQEIDQIGSGKLTEKQKAFVYGHKGTPFRYFVKKTCNEGIDSLKRALGVFPNKPDWLVLQRLLQFYRDNRMYGTKDEQYTLSIKECKTSLKRVLKINHNHSYARAFLGWILVKLNTDEAKYEIQEALRINPKSPLVLQCAGIVYTEVKEFDKAAEYLDKAIEILPDNPDYLGRMGDIYRMKYEYDVNSGKESCSEDLVTANEYYNRTIQCSDGVYIKATLSIGVIQEYQGNYSEAIETYMSVIETSNDPFYTSLACWNLADVYENSLHDSVSAIKFFDQTVEHGVEYWFGKKAAKRVIEEMQKVLQSNPDNKDALVKIGDMYNKLNEFETACQYYR
ncbi:uncharacterized protein LOC144432726 [Glandiceps talaboti]